MPQLGRRRLLAALLAASALGAGLTLLPPLRGDATAAPPDPVPLRRVWLSPDKSAAEAERAKQGVLVRLPRDEFEDLIRRAALAEAARKTPPRLVEAHYHADLVEGALVGSCQWKVVHTADAPGLLPLTPLNLALREPRFENGDALIADFDGKEPSLLVETPGDHSASAGWSARGEARPEGLTQPGGLQFDLRFPASPAAVLELDLPADRILSVDGGGLSGPQPSGTPNVNRWTVACGGRSQVSLLLRPADQPAVLRASQQTTQVLLPGGLDATFAFTIQALHQGVRELTFECDAELRPYEVIAPGLEKWEVVAPAPNGSAARLIVRLTDPLEDGTVLVRCLAPLGGAAAGGGPVSWTSPGVRLRQAAPGGETLVLKVHPDLRLAALQAGAFRLKETAPEAQADGRTALERLTFVGGGVTEAGTPAGDGGGRPRAVLNAHGVEFRARQLVWWRVDPARSSLTLQISYDVHYGRLFQTAVRLPAGWEVDQAALAPAGLLRNWEVRRVNGSRVLFVDLQRPVSPTKPGAAGPTLTVSLTPAHPGEVLDRELPFPDAAVLGARFREGALAVSFDDQTHRLEVKTSAAEGASEEDGPWGKEAPAYYYLFREPSADAGSAPAGALTLRARAPQLRAQCTSEVVLSAGRPAVDVRLRLEAERGSPESVDLYLSAPCAPSSSGDPWGWQGGDVVKAARRLREAEAAAALAALGAPDAPAAAAMLGARPPGEYWRLTFARPLRVGDPVLLHARLTPETDGDRLDVPLTAVLGASRLDGEATLDLAGPAPLQVESFGLREASPTAARPRGASPWRTFRYAGPAVGLTLRGQLQAAGRAAQGSVDWAGLTTYVGADGRLEHHYAFQASHWPGTTLPLVLPAGARLLAVEVDGIWSPRSSVTGDDAGRPLLELPVPRRAAKGEAGSPDRYEVVYTTEAPPGWLWTRVAAPTPTPPAPPAAFRRLWRLAPGLSPLDDARLRRRPGAGEGTAAAAPPVQPDDLFRLAPSPSAAWLRRQAGARPRESLSDALLGLRGDSEQASSLGAVVDRAAAALRKSGETLVVDGAALGEAGVRPAAPVAIPPQSSADESAPWESLSLAAAAAPDAYLLTTKRQLQEWREATGADAPPGPVAAAVAEAARWGRDASGRFVTAPAWLESGAEQKNALAAPQGAPDGWTEWEPLPGAGSDSEAAVVRRAAMDAAGYVLATLLALLFLWVVRKGRAARTWFLLVWLAAAGLGLLWLPAALEGLAWPAFLAGCACAVLWRLWSAARGVSTKAAGKGRSAAAGAAAALLLAVVAGRGGPPDAAPPAPVTVFIAPGPADAPERESVLAPPDLLDQLRTLAQPGAGPGAVLLGAEYAGKVVDNAAEFDAVFQAYCLADEPTTLTLPLDGVQITGDVLLDGAAVQATALPGPQAGFTLPVKGRTKAGEPPHKVELHFRTPVAATPEERGVQFTAPRLAQSRLTLRVPRGSAHLQATVKYGAQKVSAEGDYLEAELGRVAAPIRLRWAPEGWAARPGEVRFKEAYLWDLRVDASRLTAFLSYTISGGSRAELAVKVPEELEVFGVEAGRPRDAGPVRLRDWQVRGSGKERALQLNFTAPVTGDLEVLIDLAPRRPLPASFVLPLPSPQGTPLRDKGAYLAYRTRGLDVERVNPFGVTGVPPEEFAPFWPAASRPDPRTLAYASTLLREDESRPPVLGLKVRPSPPAAHARLDMEVRVGAQQADVRATAVLSAPDGDLSLVQWDMQSPQPLTVTGVSGPNVRRWSQEGDRVLVWLDAAVKGETTLELTGWLPLAAAGDAAHLDLPCLRLPAAASQDTTVRLVAGDEVALAPSALHNLASQADKAESPDRTYKAAGRADYGGAWLVRAAPAVVRVYTVAGVHDRRLAFVAVVECRPTRGEVRSLAVRVRNWDGPVRLTAPAGVRVHERGKRPDDRTWALEREAGDPGVFRVLLYGEQTAGAARDAALADVTVPGAARVERWAAAAGSGLAAEPGPGLAPADDATAALAELDPSGEAARLRGDGPIWRITSPEWRLNLARADAAAPAAPIEAFLADYRAEVSDRGGWLHEAVYWLRHEVNTDLNVALPADAEVLSVAVDGAETPPLQPEPRRLWLPLTGRPAFCQVRVRWRYTREDLARPDLRTPTLQGAADSPAVWTVVAPPGWGVGDPHGKTPLHSGPPGEAALWGRRADAQYRMSEALARQAAQGAAAATALAQAQRRFYSACRCARRAADGAPGGAAAGTAESVDELLGRNKDLAQREQFEAVREEAEEQAGLAESDGRVEVGWPEEGRPLYAWAAAGAPAPEPTLAAEGGGRPATSRAEGWAWLGFLVVVGLISLWPASAARFRLLWPEQIALVGLAGWWVAGATSVVLALLLLAVAGRALTAVRAFAGWLRRPTQARPKSTAAATPTPSEPEA